MEDTSQQETAAPEAENAESIQAEQIGQAELQQSSESQSELASLRIEVAELRDKYLRSLAEFENYKRRAIKERADLLKYQGDRIVTELLGVLDSLDLALKSSEGTHDSAAGKLHEGVKMIHKLFIDALLKFEIVGEDSLHKPFNPSSHEALSRIPTSDHPAGTVLQEFKKAYRYKDKLLRPAQVIVSTEPEPVEAQKPDLADNDG